MAGAQEGFEAFLDVRHDHEFVHDRVGGLGGDDAGLGDADVAAAVDALLGVPDGGAFHGALHGAGSAAGADVEAAQPEFVADVLGVVVFLAADGVTAPADDDVGFVFRAQDFGVAQDLEDEVGDVFGTFRVVPAGGGQYGVGVDDVAQHGEQVLADAADHLAVDEGAGRGVVEFDLDAARLLQQGQVEVLVGLHDGLAVVADGPAVEHGQRALAEQAVEAAFAVVLELVHLLAGEDLKTAFGGDARVYAVSGHSV